MEKMTEAEVRLLNVFMAGSDEPIMLRACASPQAVVPPREGKLVCGTRPSTAIVLGSTRFRSGSSPF